MKDKEKLSTISSNDDEGEDIQSTTINKTILGKNYVFKEVSETQIKENFRFSKKFYWEDEFSSSLSVSIVDTNFESSTVSLHYGNFRLLCNILFVNFPENIFSSSKLIGTGSFGSVYELEINGNISAVKIANIKYDLSKGFTIELYKEYFLNYLAYQLGVGPEVLPVFGYDLLITEKAIIFCMEKCTLYSIKNREIIQNELEKALSLMHSIGFVHLDIKSNNIVFSEKFQKHVFIDFGLSSLIQEIIGEKSLTSFMGTLRYCSEEMKKSYILRERILVDLYENDKFSLNKTLSDLDHYNENSTLSFKQPFLPNEKNNEEDDILMREFCMILNLKHQIFIKNIKKTYNLIQKCNDLPKCCSEIFSCKNIPKKIAEDKDINNILKVIKKKMHKKNFAVTKVDEQIFFYINEEACLKIMQRSFSIEAIIDMERENFVQIFTEHHWITKIFFFFDPFESEALKEVSTELWTFKKMMIDKIFETFASEAEMEQSNRFLHFISFKTEFVLHFFYERIKEMKNVRMLISLRLLFIATMAKFDSKFIQKIEQEILSLTEDKEELVLRIINFVLFWKLYNLEFDFEYKELSKWIETVLKENGSEKCNSFSKIGLLEALINNDYSKLAQFISVEGKHFFLENTNEKHSQLINNIYDHFTPQNSCLNKIIYETNNHNNSEFLIYDFHQNNFSKENNTKSKDYLKFGELFFRFPGALFWEIYALNEKESNDFFENFENFILFYQIIGVNEELFALFSVTIKMHAKNIRIFLEIILKECYETTNEFMKMFRNLCSVSTFLVYVEDHLIEVPEECRLSEEEVKEIFDKLHNLISFYKEKCVGSIKKDIFWLKIKSIEIKLLFNDNKRRVTLIKEFVEMIFPLCLSNNLLIKTTLSIFIDFQREIEESEENCLEGAYFRDAFERFCDDLVLQNGISLLGEGEIYLKLLLKLKLRKNKIEESFQYLVISSKSYEMFKDYKGTYMSISLLAIYFYVCECFNDDFLYCKYFEMTDGKNESVDYVLLRLAIYVRIKEKLEIKVRILNIYNFANRIDMIEEEDYKYMRYEIYKELTNINFYKNLKKKRLLYRKWYLYRCVYFIEGMNDLVNYDFMEIRKIGKVEVRNLLGKKNSEYYYNYNCNNNNYYNSNNNNKML